MELNLLISKYPSAFDDRLGTKKTFSTKLDVKPGSKPKFLKIRPVPFALRENIEQELQRLEDASIINKVSYSSWAAPIIAVQKKGGN